MPHINCAALILLIVSILPRLPAQVLDSPHRSITITSLNGDYQTVASGPWNRDSTWARFTSGEWVSPARPPDSGAGMIIVRTGHTVTIASSIVYDQLVVESGGRVIVAAGIGHTLSDGPGTDLTIYGTWINRGGTWTILGAARWAVADSGTFIQQTTSGISTPLSKSVLSTRSTFVYRGGASGVPASSFSGRTYGNLAFDSSGGVWTCTATGSSALLVEGDLSIGPGVKWSTGGFSGNITVQGLTSIGGEWSGSGTGAQGTHSFAGRIAVLPSGKYQLVTSGTIQGAVVIQDDLENNGSLTLPQNRQVIFSGQKMQSISGVSSTTFSNGFTSINPSGIILECPIAVDGILALRSGNVNTGSYTLTLGPRGVLNEDSTFLVVGTIRSVRTLSRGMNESFGNIGLEIKAVGKDPGPTEVTRVTGAPMVLNGRQSIGRYFDVSPSVNADLDATLRFHYRHSDLTSVNEAYLTLYKSTNGGSEWLRAGGDLDSSSNSVCLDSVNSFSRWTLGEFFPVPNVSHIFPLAGFQGEQLDILIEGSAYVPSGTGLAFSSTGIIVESVNITSATELRARIRILADAPIGTRDVSVTTFGGCAMSRSGFSVEQRPNPAPSLTRVWPTNGVRAQVLTVTLEGAGLLGGITSVSFGDSIEVLSLIENGGSLVARISVSEGARLGLRNVTVVNPAPGGGTTLLRDAFSVLNPMPTLTNVSPCEVALGESVNVLLTGSGFVREGLDVSFGEGIGVDSISVIDGSKLRARISILPSARTGLRAIAVTNAAPGGGTATLVDGFCVSNPAPKISSIVPPVCFRGRSVLLTITGKDFIPGVSTVCLSNGVRVDSLHIVNSELIVVALTIAHDFALGFTPVTVKNPWPGGGSASVAKRLEVYNPPPVVTGIVPDRGVLGQPVEVMVTGTDFFDQASSLSFGDGVTVNTVRCDSTGTILKAAVAIAESASVGVRSVILRNCTPGGGEAVLERSFTVGYPVPTLASVRPAAASRGETRDIELVGEGFVRGVTQIRLGPGVVVNSVRVESRGKLIANITVSSGAIIGARSIVAINPQPGGGSAELQNVFNVEHRAPTIVRISPVDGVKGSKLVISMEGADFCEGATSADFGPGVVVDSVTVKSQTDLEAYIRIEANTFSGCRDVRVFNSLPGGGSDTLHCAFVVRHPPPEIASVTPDRAERGRQLSVLVKGERFTAGITSVSFGARVSVTETIVRNSNELLALIEIEPSAEPGHRTITVTNDGQDGGTAVLEKGFLVTSSTMSLLETPNSDVPDRYLLYQAFPNPFNLSTRIRFGLPERSRTRVEVYNVLGILIEVLIDAAQERGFHEFSWNAAGLASGVYILRLTAQSTESERKVVGWWRVVLIK